MLMNNHFKNQIKCKYDVKNDVCIKFKSRKMVEHLPAN